MGAINQLTPPHSIEAEQAVIGSCLLSSTIHTEVFPALEAVDFYDARHKGIFEAMEQLYRANQPIDMVTVAETLGGQIERCGGFSYLSMMVDVIPMQSAVQSWVRIIAEKSKARHLAGAIEEARLAVYQGRIDAADIAESFTRRVKSMIITSARALDASKVVDRTMVSISDRAEGRTPPGLMCGFYELNRMLYGFHPGDLIVLAARPSMGKTALSMNIGCDIAKCGAKVLVFSLEMKSEQLVERILSTESGVPLAAIRCGNLDQRNKDALSEASKRVARLSLRIDDQAGLSVGQLQARAKAESFNSGLDMLIVDYLQLLNAPGAQSREREVSIISSGLKQLAKDLNVPVLALSQLNRGLENRTDRTPKLSDLRDSGSIEQDADVVLMLHRDPHVKHGPMVGRAEVIVAKHRNGPTGTLYLNFEGHICSFSDTGAH